MRIARHENCFPLYPQTRTSPDTVGISQTGHQATSQARSGKKKSQPKRPNDVNVLAIIFIASVLTCFLAQAYMAWKIFALYRLLGDRKKDIDFYSLAVWTLSGAAWANWRLGSQIREFDNLPADLREQLPLVRRQTKPVKVLYYVGWFAFVALFISSFFRH